jgi:hypothetical protein
MPAPAGTEIHVGDVGTALRLHLVDEEARDVDVSGASLIEFVFVSPARRRFTRAALPSTTGLDGRVQYVLAEGDLDAAGSWRLQARVAIGPGQWYSGVVTVPVAPNL